MPYLARNTNSKAEIYLFADEPKWNEQTTCGVCEKSIGYWTAGTSDSRVLLPHYDVPIIKPGECFKVELIVKEGE